MAIFIYFNLYYIQCIYLLLLEEEKNTTTREFTIFFVDKKIQLIFQYSQSWLKLKHFYNISHWG